ncbi:MAG: nucleoside triphosphate pyrophosphohydrolase [Dechloromonas sp.]|nr:nucleoside triphosphate pyrophosphohydrolase [Dechloromonas sp.]
MKRIAPVVLHSLRLVSIDGITELEPPAVQPELVGLKAFGLACLPDVWVPPFCVLDQAFVQHVVSTQNVALVEKYLNTLEWFRAPELDEFIVRSSATHETIRSRGALVSHRSSKAQLLEALTRCIRETSESEGDVHWLVQPYVSPIHQGHLSNERRISLAKRDWLLEFESKGLAAPQESKPIAIRKWREGADLSIAPLECSAAIEIDGVLRTPVRWASDRRLRLHFEWVWNGKKIYIVQSDTCDEQAGVNPYDLLPKAIPAVSTETLNCFRKATKSDFDKYRKLSNTKLYTDLGYVLPDFFVLDDQKLIKELIDGNLSTVLADDLKLLTTRPLVFRTDGVGIPPEDRQMLPRSDELRSVPAVVEWFSKKLRGASEQIKQHFDKLVFICHHYLPAAASAWSYADPNKRIVRIEALWGIPEGMYWFSHDAYEVDTGDTILSRAEASAKRFRLSKRERYKEWYIAPDDVGVWRAHRTDAKHDWKGTLQDEWYAEIAITTRKIAEALGYPINLMWFLDLHKDASSHVILPWFHEKSELVKGDLKGSPRHKYSHSKIVEIRTAVDLQMLSSKVDDNDLHGISRITVTPSDSELVRNLSFLSDLAKIAIKAQATIELNGGVLSHVFYILSRAGCAVEVVDLFGAKEETLVFRKLVRDKIPESIINKGEQVTQVTLRGENLLAALKAKLIEEAMEVADSTSTTEIVEELADVQEVIHAISKHVKITKANVESVRKEKREKRGGFDAAKVLVKTSAPGSLVDSTNARIKYQDSPDLFDSTEPTINPASLLEPDISLHQDFRLHGSNRERFLEIEFPAALSSSVHRVTEFSISGATELGRIEIPLVGEWILSRNGAQLKVRLSLRDKPLEDVGQQSQLDFDSQLK